MAITKILNIHCTTEGNPAAHLKNALEYIQNPDKTEQCRLVGSVNCLPNSAFEQMLDPKCVWQIRKTSGVSCDYILSAG